MTTDTRAPRHDELNDELNAYLDGQLNAAREAEVAAHVASCAVCTDEIEQLRLTRSAMRELPLLRAPRTFVVAAPEPEPAVRWKGLLSWGWRIGSVASAACVLIAALSTGSGGAPVRSSGEGAATSASIAKSEAPAAPAPAPPAAAGRAA